jgi:CheY-like chemotaxis protein
MKPDDVSHRVVEARRTRKILVVDDSAVVRTSARWALEGAGYQVILLETPLMYSQVLNTEKPDLVLMDVSMPGLRGDALITIGQRSESHRCPIVLFSAQPPEELSDLVTSLGLAGYIEKDLAHLLAEVPKYLP